MEKFVAISDLHGYLPELPKCDYVLICGDIVPLEVQKSIQQSLNWFTSAFTNWVNSLDCKKVIFIAGNHDFFLQEIYNNPNSTIQLSLDNKIVYLQDTYYYTEEGNKIYGTPWCQSLKNWAFYLPNDELEKIYSYISEDTDILLTHMPSNIGQTGMVLDATYLHSFKELGNAYLGNKIKNLFNCKYALCGHIHTGNHEITELENGCKVINVSLKREDYKIIYPPFEFEV